MGYESLRYDEVRQKSVHNAFQRIEGITDQLLYWRIRSLEADIHRSHPLDRARSNGELDEWFVYHHHLDTSSTTHSLHDFLQLCAGAHRAMPGHEVITLFVDMKEGFANRITSRHSRARFDAILEHHLGRALYRPADLQARAPDATGLVEAVRHAGWPTLEELRGRFIVVLTGSETEVGGYVGSRERPTDRAAFVAGRATSKRMIGQDPDTVVYNMPYQRVALAREVRRLGLVSRVYDVEDRRAWDRSVAAGCHHIAVDAVNARVDPWATTSGPHGHPFEVIGAPTPADPEPGPTTGIWSRSGDVWEQSDSCYFRHRRSRPGRRQEAYEFVVSGPGSHTEPWTKGGIMARQTLAADSRYFAVLRPGSGSGLRVQFRAGKGRATTVLESRVGRTWQFGSRIDEDAIAHVRMVVSADRCRFAGFGSVDGEEWVELGRYDFGVPLLLHGLAVSAHGLVGGAKYLFVPTGGSDAERFDREEMIGHVDAPCAGWCDHREHRRWRVVDFEA